MPLAEILERARILPGAVDVMPQGLDADYVAGGVDYGQVRRPLPIAKAFKDAILAYEMNDEPLPPDNGFPVRLIVPGWVGIANIKWVGQIQVAKEPLFSYWNTINYVLSCVSSPGSVARPAPSRPDCGRGERAIEPVLDRVGREIQLGGDLLVGVDRRRARWQTSRSPGRAGPARR